MSINSLSAPSASMALLQASQASNAQNLKDMKDSKNDTRAKEAADEFEAVFITEMIKPMFEGISTDGMFGGGKGEEVFRGMMVQEYGKLIAKNGGIGLSSQIKEQIIKMQEQADNVTKTAN